MFVIDWGACCDGMGLEVVSWLVARIVDFALRSLEL